MFDQIERYINAFDCCDMKGDSESLVFAVHTDDGFYLTIDRDEREAYVYEGENHPHIYGLSLMLSSKETKLLSDFLVFALSADKGV